MDGEIHADGHADLARQFVAGDESALEEAFRRWSPTVRGVVRRRLGADSDVDDVVQVVFVSAWRTRSSFRPGRGSLPGWLLGITRHTVADRLSARAREQRTLAAVVPLVPTEEVDTTAADVVATQVVVRDAMRGLSPDQRRLVVLAYWEGLTHAEIATRTGLPLGTVKSHLRRALAALRADQAISGSAA